MTQPISSVFNAITINDGFWGRLIARNSRSTLPHVIEQCDLSGYITRLEIAAGRSDAEFKGGSHEDSDLCKVMEGAAYSLAHAPDPALSAYLDSLIELIAAAQEDDGYFNSYFTVHKKERYTGEDRSHELYCAGHLIEAAVAHFEITGSRRFLGIAVKLADHLDATFGRGKLETVPGHQGLELALTRLYKATGEKRYLDLCRFFVDMRGDKARVARDYAGKPVIENDRTPGRNRPPEYRQDHLPAIEQREPIGHAVRALYFYSAMADIAMECQSLGHTVAVTALWDNIVGKHLYLSGGVGTHQHRDEGFGDDYLLPNDAGYCETCGGIALLMFTQRMNLLNGGSRYADVIETILYNHMLACTDLEGVNFFYRNPLASDGTRKRRPWPNPACCPTNIVRMIPQISQYLYAVNGDDLYVDQFVDSTADLVLDSGAVKLTQATRYPWDGHIEIAVQPDAPQTFALHVRIPGWVDGRPVPGDLYRAESCGHAAPTIRVNGETCDLGSRINGYCTIRRTWNAGDCVVIDFPMPVRRVHANDKVEANRNRVALMRGPLLYCVEAVDHAIDVDDLAIGVDADLVAEHRSDLLGGVTVIREANGPLTAVPYYAWNNREPGKMAVWLCTGSGKDQLRRAQE